MKKLLLLILFLLPLQTFASGGHGEGDAYSILLNIGLLFLVGFIAMIILIEIILNGKFRPHIENKNITAKINIFLKRLLFSLAGSILLVTFALSLSIFLFVMPYGDIMFSIYGFPVWLLLGLLFLKKMNFFK